MDDIGALSTSCASCFNTLTRSLRTSTDEFKKQMTPIEIDNEYARFKIWAGNTGALQRGRSSLDARLRDSVVLRAAVLKFLGQLQDSLSKSAEITTGSRLPYEQGGDVTHGPDEEIEDDSDTSDTSSDLETEELAMRLDEIKDIMEHLYRLSFKIRNTRYRSLTKKALLMEEKDPQTGKDLFSTYAIFDRRHVQESLNHLRLRPSLKEFATEPARDASHSLLDVFDAGDRLLDSDNFLQDRLAKAITDRRRYFAYWRRHALKLSHVTDELAPQQNFTALVKPAEPVSEPPTTPLISGNFIPAPGPKTMVSGTDFSMYNRELDDQLDTETMISYATTAYDVDGNSSELPPPPPDAANNSEFVCPYCWIACPSRQGKGKAWQEHIRQDLQPYVCTYEKCPEAHRMYASRHTWLEHERLVHRRIWRCFEHRSFISKSEKGLLQHFLDCHKGLDQQQIESLLDIAETTVADDRKTCPFCYSIGPFAKGFYNHVAFHQEQLATFAIPRNFDSNEEEDSGRAEGIRSAGSLRSVALYFTDGDSSLDSDESDVSVHKIDNPLLDSAGIGDDAVVRLLLDKGANPESMGNHGQTPLAWAATNGHEAVVRLLLERGADPESKDNDGQTPLALAAANGHEAVVSLLLERGADSEATDNHDQTPLALAATNGQEAVVRLLLERGAHPEPKDNYFQATLAETMHRRALEDQEKVLGPKHPDTLTSVSKLGSVLDSQSKYEEAEAMHRRALRDRQKVLGSEHPDTLTSFSNLGSVLSRQGKYKEAEAMHRRALEGYEKVLGPESLRALTSVSNLGFVLDSQGKYEEAEAMHRRVLQDREKVLGPEHPDTLTSVSNLGSFFSNQQKYEEAGAMYRRALEGYEKVLGPEHLDTLASVSNLGFFLDSQGKYEEAEAMHQRAVEGYEKVLGPEHPDTLASISNLVLFLDSQGKYEEAEAMHGPNP